MFENVDGRTTDRRRSHWYTNSSPQSLGSGELKSMQKSAMTDFVSGQAEDILIYLGILQFIVV